MKTTDYIPIPCTEYSRYELAVLHRQTLRLVWTDNDILHCEMVTAVDLLTWDSEEFLICLNFADEKTQIRLDKIKRIQLA